MNRHQVRQVAEGQPARRGRALGRSDFGLVVVLAILFVTIAIARCA